MTGYIIHDDAKADLLDIWNYISRRSVEDAEKQIDELYEMFDTIVLNLDIGRPRNELMQGLRSFIAGQHVIYYRVERDKIQVKRVIHGARDLSKIAFE